MSAERKRTHHTWAVVGQDPDTFIPNIWKCKSCGIFKAVGPSGSGRMNEGDAIEYSRPNGAIIPNEGQSVPQCHTGGTVI